MPPRSKNSAETPDFDESRLLPVAREILEGVRKRLKLALPVITDPEVIYAPITRREKIKGLDPLASEEYGNLSVGVGARMVQVDHLDSSIYYGMRPPKAYATGKFRTAREAIEYLTKALD